MITAEQFNARGADYLPGLLGIVITRVEKSELRAGLQVKKAHMAPNDYLHAATVVALADTCAGYACVVNLPEGVSGFTTIELKSNHLGTARAGKLECVTKAVHRGRTTQVWDSVVTHAESGRTLALFRCTQMLLYAKPGD